jgi:hypothetical protein
MEQNNPQDPKIITIVAKRPEEAVLNSVRPDESFSTIPCYIVQVQMVPLGESHSHTKISKEKVKRKETAKTLPPFAYSNGNSMQKQVQPF